MRLPDFFIIGAAKAGTTSLYDMLIHHPGVFLPDRKEPEFFARDDLYGEGIENYAWLFEPARPDQLTGEGSTLYSLSPLFPDTAARIARHVPQARFIYVLRQPVERAYSFYVQLVKNYQNATGDHVVHRRFEDFILPECHARAAPRAKALAPFNAHFPDTPELCLAGSDYPAQINAYLAHVPRDRMLFLKFEDFRRDRDAVMAQVCDFLGLPQTMDHPAGSGRRNVSRDHFHRLGEQLALDAFRQEAGALWKLRGMLPARLRQRLRERVLARALQGEKPHEPPAMLPETRALLSCRFATQIPELTRLTGLDLSEWGLDLSKD
ncbi:sulfotransferase family protein [Paracoccus actinidiae]|uniref:sulfotransferase family protein n=1 Tax=Paracoccus actinidiae TaxID=3064531 RepID=UPI0027D337F1|nr:sulfotransferase [Paracoccus sp. M09]